MGLAVGPRHDEHVHVRSLAQAMAAAARRQHGRARTWAPVVWPTSPRRRDELAGLPTDPVALARTALAQQLEAASARERARTMLVDDHEMRLRLGELTARAAAQRDRAGTAC